MTVMSLLNLATSALQRRDEEAFRELEDTVRGWLFERERDTLLALLDSMADAAELLSEDGEPA